MDNLDFDEVVEEDDKEEEKEEVKDGVAVDVVDEDVEIVVTAGDRGIGCCSVLLLVVTMWVESWLPNDLGDGIVLMGEGIFFLGDKIGEFSTLELGEMGVVVKVCGGCFCNNGFWWTPSGVGGGTGSGLFLSMRFILFSLKRWGGVRDFF